MEDEDDKEGVDAGYGEHEENVKEVTRSTRPRIGLGLMGRRMMFFQG